MIALLYWGLQMYTVIFKRKDKKPDEIYYYEDIAEAKYHFELFKNDDSDLYIRIELWREQKSIKMLIDSIKFNL